MLYERQPAGIDDKEVQKAFEHAKSDFPKEVCGVFTKSIGYVRLTNIAVEPEHEFTMKEYKKVAANSDDVLAIFHSHTNGSQCPSAIDMEVQISTAKPWCVASLENNGQVTSCFFWGSDNIPNLIGRQYRSGTMDCYSLIKDAYSKLFDIELPEFPRDNAFWEEGQDLYTKGFERAGFKKIKQEELRVGDVILGSIRAKGIVNHGAIVLNEKDIIHHLEKQLSRRDSLSRWFRHLNICLRHKDLTENKARSGLLFLK